MHETISVDFPVLFPLCEAVIIHGVFVSFCQNERVTRSRLCRFHLDMKRGRQGRWHGREVVVG
jgi:hypothetical protein